MPRRLVHVSIATALVALAACTSSGSTSVTSTTAAPVRPTGAVPSSSAKMICAREARQEIQGNLGIAPSRVTTPSWRDRRYSCSYVYPHGTMGLAVSEPGDTATTSSYFEQLATRLGRRADAVPLGQAAFVTANGSVVVRKDDKVLEVDISDLPAQFGNPAQAPGAVALSVAATIMGCWTGA